MFRPPPAQIVVGPSSHGVSAYARDLADAVRQCDPEAVVDEVDDYLDLEACAAKRSRVHLHVTDGLLGDSLEDAAARVARLTVSSRVALTLHDLPQESDGPRNLVRRSAAYAQMVKNAVGVAVNSRHEALLVGEHLDSGLRPTVVPLGTRLDRSPRAAEPSATTGDLAILMAGYVYPGKGHDDVIEAAGIIARRVDSDVVVRVIGGVSPGHEAEASVLAARAAQQGVRFETMGFLEPADYRRLCRSDGIPVVAHRHYSASRSLLDWAEQGRRPLVVTTRYTTEMDRLRPGTLHLVAPTVDALADALEDALRHPESTILADGHPIGPTLDDSARAYLDWWGGLPW